MTGRLLDVEGLRVTGRMSGRSTTIVDDVSLALHRGETLGIVGESGSGKSMTARAIMGLLPDGVRAEGRIRYRGEDLAAMPRRQVQALRGRFVTMIFQDPFTMLNPLVKCGSQIVERIRDDRGRRLSRAARRAEARRRLAEVGITDPAVADAYPFELSGGMRQRAGIAAALALDPEVIIADEPTTALDVTTQRDLLAKLKALQESRGMGMILITHDLRVAFSVCDRVSICYAGRILESGPASTVDSAPRHPYSLGLLTSEPPADRRVTRLVSIRGSVPRPDEVAGQCSFAPRCEWVTEPCVTQRPQLSPSGDGHLTACLRHDGIAAEMHEARSRAWTTAPPGEPAAGGEVVRVEAVTKEFAGRSLRALDEVSLHVSAGECVGLVGESGSGKTTLGRIIVGLDRPTSGQVLVDGEPPGRAARRSVQMVFQDPYSTLNPRRTIGATLAEALAVRGAGRSEVSRLLAAVGLPVEYRNRKPVALSGGERQRVALARALAADPRIIVCDEVSSALDVSVQAQIINLIRSLHRETGKGIVFITHDLAVVRQVAARVYVLWKGRIVEEGPVGDVLDRPRHPYTQQLVSSAPGASLAAE
ncbi:ABC transporter ATP-binding protein [Amycolatopsis jejuensis]|uniref:dipeptide ABC transporter ATP-binding protein n=1 Tax=Amycolatopsis jejuensis TaxID=330084 RepID=UPI0005253DD5|nr:ABC transporter ATP-binding protein [Amycolatopsis jejuensis]